MEIKCLIKKISKWLIFAWSFNNTALLPKTLRFTKAHFHPSHLPLRPAGSLTFPGVLVQVTDRPQEPSYLSTFTPEHGQSFPKVAHVLPPPEVRLLLCWGTCRALTLPLRPRRSHCVPVPQVPPPLAAPVATVSSCPSRTPGPVPGDKEAPAQMCGHLVRRW